MLLKKSVKGDRKVHNYFVNQFRYYSPKKEETVTYDDLEIKI